jgi:hypothetical protein
MHETAPLSEVEADRKRVICGAAIPLYKVKAERD